MLTTPIWEHTVLRSGDTTVVVEYGDHGRARLDVTATTYGRDCAETGRLVCEAVHQARLHDADRVEGALDASGPTCGAVLEALHRRVGNDVESIAMRRAGSSVMVVLELRPAPRTARTRARARSAERTPRVPTQPSRLPHRSGTPAERGPGGLTAVQAV